MSAFDPSIIERVKKLLSLATSTEPNEAAAALRKAQKLMIENGLTTSDIEVGELKTGDEVRSIATKSKTKGWELALFNGIAEAFACGLMFRPGEDFVTDSRMYGAFVFVGPKAEVTLCVYAANVLQRQLARARSSFTKTLQGYLTRGEKSAEVDSYCEGWVHSALSKVNPLVPNPARIAAIKKWIDAKATKETKLQARKPGSISAMSQGLKDGSAAEVHRPMSGEPEAKTRALGDGS